jgi:hypothetical protein
LDRMKCDKLHDQILSRGENVAVERMTLRGLRSEIP